MLSFDRNGFMGSRITVHVESNGDIRACVYRAEVVGEHTVFKSEPVSFDYEDHGRARFGLWLNNQRDIGALDRMEILHAMGLDDATLRRLVLEMDDDDGDVDYVFDDDAVRFERDDGDDGRDWTSHADLPSDVPKSLWQRARSLLAARLCRG